MSFFGINIGIIHFIGQNHSFDEKSVTYITKLVLFMELALTNKNLKNISVMIIKSRVVWGKYVLG